MTDHIIRLQNHTEISIPEICNRTEYITLNFGVPDEETIQISGNITLSEVCFLYMMLGKFINKELGDV